MATGPKRFAQEFKVHLNNLSNAPIINNLIEKQVYKFGPVGNMGIKGSKGDTGEVGKQGNMGCKGKKNIKGYKGTKGRKGSNIGYIGEKGAKGSRGTVGKSEKTFLQINQARYMFNINDSLPGEGGIIIDISKKNIHIHKQSLYSNNFSLILHKITKGSHILLTNNNTTYTLFIRTLIVNDGFISCDFTNCNIDYDFTEFNNKEVVVTIHKSKHTNIPINDTAIPLNNTTINCICFANQSFIISTYSDEIICNGVA